MRIEVSSSCTGGPGSLPLEIFQHLHAPRCNLVLLRSKSYFAVTVYFIRNKSIYFLWCLNPNFVKSGSYFCLFIFDEGCLKRLVQLFSRIIGKRFQTRYEESDLLINNSATNSRIGGKPQMVSLTCFRTIFIFDAGKRRNSQEQSSSSLILYCKNFNVDLA